MATTLRAKLRERRDRDRLYKQAEYWDRKARENQGSAVSGWRNRTLNVLYREQELDLLRHWLPEIQGSRILDLGCGTGQIARNLADRGGRVVGVDFSARAIEIARREGFSGNPTYRVQSIFELADDSAFDVVLSMGCLAVACRGAADLNEALRRIHNALKPGGRLVVVEPIHRGPVHFVLDLSLREFRRTISSSGFAIEQSTALHFWPIGRILGEVDCPAWLTVAGYRVGESVLALVGRGFFGDYKALLATRG
jgi:2-polyprenyl-3-methyl-5-hydroxy-6-metoxy-1,4-benzoquinol methylase